MHHSHRYSDRQENSQEQETYNRLFILGGKGCSEDVWRESFEKYGEVKDIWIVKDRQSNEEKGICYITYSKASEAALAIEEMNGRFLPKHPKPLKVLLANNRREGNIRDPKEDEKMLRIFIMIPKTYTEEDVRSKFSRYGDIEYVRLLKDPHSSKPKGLAFVKYYRAHHAAKALEECDPSFKAVFASTRGERKHMGDDRFGSYEVRHSGNYERSGSEFGGGYGSSMRPPSLLGGGGGGMRGSRHTENSPMDTISNFPHVGERCLEVLCPAMVTEEQMHRLFDIIPGLECCNMDKNAGLVYIQYSSASSAAYAKAKLAGFEYPPGFRLAIRYPQARPSAEHSGANRFQDFEIGGGGGGSNESRHMGDLGNVSSALTSAMESSSGGDSATIQKLVETLNKATNIIQQAGLSNMLSGSSPAETGPGERLVSVTYCNVQLPERKPFAMRDAPIEERLFIVSQPEPFPESILQDAMVRFGGLVDAYFMPGKNFGYAKFASKASAKKAIEVLHGQAICNNRVKVILADPPRYGDNDTPEGKRPRMS